MAICILATWFTIVLVVVQVKCYMQQLLRGLDHCHCRGILHRDIKGSNLLIDNSGILKIADFGLASFFDPDQRLPLTSRVVTLWYRPPELLLGATNYGVAVDLWSAGCILAELYAGKPIMPGRTEASYFVTSADLLSVYLLGILSRYLKTRVGFQFRHNFVPLIYTSHCDLTYCYYAVC